MTRLLISFSIEIRRRLWLFALSGLWLPAFLVRHRLWKKSELLGFCVCALLSAWGTNAVAATCNSAGGGTWNAIPRWSCGHVPLAADDVFVLNGHTVTIDTAAVAQNVTVNAGGILRFATAAAHSLAVGNAGAQGNITIQATGTLDVDTASNVTHTLSLVGNLANSGTLNLATDANSLCNTTFNRNGNQTVSGAGAYTFNLITLNMGATNANVLDMQSAMTVPSPFLTITNGTYKHSNTSNITPWTADPNIPASGGFWLNAAATVTTTGFNVTVNGGSLRISAGTMNIGNVDTTLLTLGNAATTLFQMDGGALKVTGGINSSVNTGAGTFTMSGGTITLQTIDAGAVYTVLLGSATTLNWSGGTIIATNGNNTTDDVDIRSATQNITGGTLQIGSAATTSANDISYINGAGGQLNVWNLVLASGPARNILMRSSTNILNDLTIQTLNNLNPGAGLAINIGAGNTSGNWTNNGTFTQGTTTVTLLGTANSNIAGTTATTFYNLVVNKTAPATGVTITSATNPTVSNALTLTRGSVNTGANTLITGANCNAPSVTRTSGFVIGNLRKQIPAAAFTCTFEVGSGTNYTPVAMVFASAPTVAGTVTASTTGTEHASIASSGIDASKSVNRFWTLTNNSLTLAAAGYNATYTYTNGSPVDYDAGSTVANFIVERWSGALWFPTTPTGSCSTTVCTISGQTTFGDFAIGEPLAGFNGNPGAFNVFETSTPAGAVLGRIYTKLVSTNFTLAIVAVANNTVNIAPTANQVTIDVLNSTGTPGVFNAATNCWSGWATVGSATVVAAPAWGGIGRVNVAITAPATAVRNARIRVTQAVTGLIGCSTDNFTIRPQLFTITSIGPLKADNITTAGAPAIKTGANFNLTSASVAGYDGTPSVDFSVGMVSGTPNAGTIGGSFGAAPIATGTATGANFFYSEVGNFGLNTNAVHDDTFTSVDQGNDCTADFSIALVGGKYGCKIGSTQVAYATGLGFGRFTPFDFAVVRNTPSFNPACSSTFTYVGQPFSYSVAPVLTVTARNSSGTTTQNYAGAYAKFSNVAGTSLNQAPYDTQPLRYSRFDALGGSTTPFLNYSSLPATTADPAISTFTAGVGTLTFSSGTGLSFTRSATTPNLPFNADISLAINVVDSDGVAFASNPAAFGAATAGNGIAFSPVTAKQMRFGRLTLGNAFGSELLDLPIPIETQYYNSNGVYITNIDDSCTTIALNSVFLSSGAATGGGAFVSGKGNLKITKPLSKVSIDLCVDLDGAIPTDPLCVALSPANKTWLQWKWSGPTFDKDAKARATFGVYKNADEFIYLQEVY